MVWYGMIGYDMRYDIWYGMTWHDMIIIWHDMV